jgi:demethylmenaquinone methyltransferase/2-methoxy-6-polyprenyl-1,4-benzoquinol methylase
MSSLRNIDLDSYLRDPARKQSLVTPLFDLIAPRYDDFTRLFSFGMDREWKRELIDALAARTQPNAQMLDLACGTGDLAFAAAALAPQGTVTGVDASARMIERATHHRSQRSASNVRFQVGDMTALPFADGSIDAVTSGYGLRNVPDHFAALREIARVLRPGGRLLTLDFYRPESPLWRTLFLGYLRAAGNAVGWLWHREPVVYGYIAPSIDHFVSWQQFRESLGNTGFTVEHVSPKLLGGVAIHVASRS